MVKKELDWKPLLSGKNDSVLYVAQKPNGDVVLAGGTQETINLDTAFVLQTREEE